MFLKRKDANQCSFEAFIAGGINTEVARLPAEIVTRDYMEARMNVDCLLWY